MRTLVFSAAVLEMAFGAKAVILSLQRQLLYVRKDTRGQFS